MYWYVSLLCGDLSPFRFAVLTLRRPVLLFFTSGMDIKQGLSAVAAVTLGKDMTFRDYAQGAFRMRGIGKGQKVQVRCAGSTLLSVSLGVSLSVAAFVACMPWSLGLQ